MNIEPVDQCADFVKLTVDFHYDVTNETTTEAGYDFGASEDMEHEIERADLHTEVNEITWNGEPLSFKKEQLYGGSVVKASAHASIPAGGIGEARAISTLYRHATDHYDIAMSYFTEDLEILVSHPHDLDVRAGPLADLEDEFKKEKRPGNVTTWHANRALLPKQGVTLRWRQSPTDGLPAQKSTRSTSEVTSAR